MSQHDNSIPMHFEESENVQPLVSLQVARALQDALEQLAKTRNGRRWIKDKIGEWEREIQADMDNVKQLESITAFAESTVDSSSSEEQEDEIEQPVVDHGKVVEQSAVG